MLEFMDDANLYLSLNEAKMKRFALKQKQMTCDDSLQEFTLLVFVIEQHGGSVGKDDALVEFENERSGLQWSKPVKPATPKKPSKTGTTVEQSRYL